MKPYNDITDPKLVKALAHPLRVQILTLLDQRAASPSELAGEIGASLGLVSYHVRRLATLGVIELVKTTPVRGALEHHYRAKERASISEDGWAKVPPVVRKRMIGAAVQDIGTSVSAASAAAGFDRPDAHASRTALVLDDKGWADIGKEIAALLSKAMRLEAACAKRLERGGGEGARPAELACLLFAPGEKRQARRRTKS